MSRPIQARDLMRGDVIEGGKHNGRVVRSVEYSPRGGGTVYLEFEPLDSIVRKVAAATRFCVRDQ